MQMTSTDLYFNYCGISYDMPFFAGKVPDEDSKIVEKLKQYRQTS